MKQVCFLILGLLGFLTVNAQTTTSQEDGYFDPVRDPILSTINGKVRFVQSEEVIARAADLRLGKLSTVETFDKVFLNGHWYFTCECRFAPEPDQAAKVYLRLKGDENGNYYADSRWVACIGAPCGSCDWDINTNDCFCKTDRPGEPGEPGACNQIWSTDPLLKKIKIKPN